MMRARALVLGSCLVASLAAPRSLLGADAPQPCAPGRYLLAQAVTGGAGAPSGGVLQIDSGGVSIPGVCTSIVAKVQKGTKKGITKLKVEWPVIACTGFTGKKVVLAGKIVEGCTKLVGKLKAKKAGRGVKGNLSRCGDGTVDSTGGGEACEPPGTATCSATCQQPPGDVVQSLGIANYAVSVPTDGDLLLGPITVTLLDAAGAPLGTITKTFTDDGQLSEFTSPDGETGTLLVHSELRNFSPPRHFRLTLTIGERSLTIDILGQQTLDPMWLTDVTLTTPADMVLVPPPVGDFGPGENGTTASLTIFANGQLVIEAADLVRGFEATGLEEIGFGSFAAAALLATLNDQSLALDIASHFSDGGAGTPAGAAAIHPEFHKTPLCASLLAAVTGGAGGIACTVCIPALLAVPATSGISAVLATPACIVCGAGTGLAVSELLICKTEEYGRKTARDCANFKCNPENGEQPEVDDQTEHDCWCRCNDDRCNEQCALFAVQLGTTFPDGSPRPTLAPVLGGCSGNICQCAFPPDEYCRSNYKDYCGGGSRVAGGGRNLYDCPRVSCRDGRWSSACPGNPALVEKCDPTADAAGKKGTCNANEGCSDGCTCVPCTCGPGTPTPTCPPGELGAFCGPADCQCHDGCRVGSDCPAGKACVNSFCVGAGALRFTISWQSDTDVDLHVLTPLRHEIYFGNRNADGGTLDVDSCVSTCAKGAENVFFASAPLGHYEVWVVNYAGRKTARVTLNAVQGSASVPKYVYLPATAGAASTHFPFEVSAR